MDDKPKRPKLTIRFSADENGKMKQTVDTHGETFVMWRGKSAGQPTT